MNDYRPPVWLIAAVFVLVPWIGFSSAYSSLSSNNLCIRKLWGVRTVSSAEIVQLSAETLRHRRAKAAICLMYLFGIRSCTLVTVRLNHIDLEKGELHIKPSEGVNSKNDKAGTVYALDFPAAVEVASAWHRYVADLRTASNLWYAPIDPLSREIDPERETIGNYRTQPLRKEIQSWLKLNGMQYKPPHALRRGHAIEMARHATTLVDLKTISQNLMHNNIGVTDKHYLHLAGDERRQQVRALSRRKQPAISAEADAMLLLQQAMSILQKSET